MVDMDIAVMVQGVSIGMRDVDMVYYVVMAYRVWVGQAYRV